jgi:hypothetical protein
MCSVEAGEIGDDVTSASPFLLTLEGQQEGDSLFYHISALAFDLKKASLYPMSVGGVCSIKVPTPLAREVESSG